MSNLEIEMRNMIKSKNSIPTFTESNKSETVFDILLHISLISLVLQLGYSVFLQKMERNVTVTEVTSGLKSIMGGFLEEYQNTVGEIDTKWIEAMEVWFENSDEFDNANNLVKQKNWMFILMLIFSIVLFLITMRYMCKTKNMKHGVLKTVGNNVGLLLLVGIIEGYFIFKVMLNFVPTKPSLMSDTVIDRLSQISDDQKTNKCFTRSCPPQLPQLVIIAGYCIPVIFLIFMIIYLSNLREKFPKTGQNSLSGVVHENMGFFRNIIDGIPGILWQGSFVAIVVSVAFLTIGKKQEELILTGTINKIVDSYVGTIYDSMYEISPSSAENFMNKLRDIQKPDMVDEDKKVLENNKLLVRKAIFMCIVIAGCALIFHFLFIVMSKNAKMRLYRKQNIKFIAISAVIAALCSFLSEFNFMVAVAAKSEPVSVNDVGKIALNIIKYQTGREKIFQTVSSASYL